MNMVEEFKRQHLETYKNATIETIRNNTTSLVESDIISLVKKPPLDSMDTIKSKLLSLAKKEKLILNTEVLDTILEDYRSNLSSLLINLSDIRISSLKKIVEQFKPKRDNETIKIQKKDLEIINKKIKSQVKVDTIKTIDETLLCNLDKLYGNIPKEQQEKIDKDFSKFMKSTYVKQLNEGILIKILVKDRTLLNGISEQGERYLFTKNNSHIFDENMENV